MWHKDQKSFVLLCWPLSMRPRQHDRFVLIGLCWLYGRSDFSPPPPVLACSAPSLVQLGWVLSIHTPSGGTWVMQTRGIGLVCMFLLARLPLLAQNLARICAGLLGRARCLQSPILSFPSRFPGSGDWCSSGWGPITCQLSRAAWQGL